MKVQSQNRTQDFRFVLYAGVEMTYEMYSPILQKIEVLKLEKRVDPELFYLRDAPKEHSTFPFNFEPVPLPPGTPVPVNTVQVRQDGSHFTLACS